jgi:hypothetical protein
VVFHPDTVFLGMRAAAHFGVWAFGPLQNIAEPTVLDRMSESGTPSTGRIAPTRPSLNSQRFDKQAVIVRRF